MFLAFGYIKAPKKKVEKFVCFVLVGQKISVKGVAWGAATLKSGYHSQIDKNLTFLYFKIESFSVGLNSTSKASKGESF